MVKVDFLNPVNPEDPEILSRQDYRILRDLQDMYTVAKNMKRLLLVLGVVVIAVVSTVYFIRPWSSPTPVYVAETTGAVQNPTVEITYIANEGVLISAGGKQVLIDGLHREYERDYAFLPPADREKIETAKAPFDKIDLVLVSHRHLDHFHPESIGLHLQHNPKATFVSSQQVVEEVEKNFKNYPAISARVTATTPPSKERVAMKVAGIDFEILRLSHGTGRHATIQNLGHIIKLGGKKLLHVGDADTAIENFEKFNLDEEQIDIVFIPYWFLLGPEGQTVVRDHIKPKQIIAVHISPGESERTITQMKQLFPGAVAFTTMLEKKTY